MIEIKEEKEKVILVGVNLPGDPGPAGNDGGMELPELSELARTAGAEVAGEITQNLPTINSATYVGKGKIEEIRAMIDDTGATGIICDDELTTTQLRNLSDALDVKIMDRTLVILDIFARRAASSEGKIQVELAQLRYSMSHLAGSRSYLSRLGGGIGTRGPGEKKLEMDRRLIGKRISILRDDIKQMENSREVRRKQRERSNVPLAAIVGYTNAGKSTLLNSLTSAGILEEDELFATLDPVTRKLRLENGQTILLTDTVGFIRKLPHNLIDAFRSTLEEAKYADILIHVVDASNPEMDRQMATVYDTLHDLDIAGKPIITLFNKMDLVQDTEAGNILDFRADKSLSVSLKGRYKKTSLEKIRAALMEMTS